MEQMTNRKYLILLAVLLLITASSAVIPASWFGIGNKKTDNSLDLTSVKTIDVVGKNKEGTPATWKDLTEQAFKDQPQILAELKAGTVNKKDIEILNDPNNLTASFSKNVYVASTYLDANGGADQATEEEIVTQLTGQELAKMATTPYLFKDLNISKAESRDSIKTYGNALASVLKDTVTESSIKSEMAGMVDYLNTKNEKSLDIIAVDSKKVDTKIKNLISLSVPLSASAYHLITINKLAVYRDNLQNLSKLATDPLRAKIAFSQYIETSTNALSLYKDLSKYFDIKNVAFSAKDTGYVFTVGYNSNK